MKGIAIVMMVFVAFAAACGAGTPDPTEDRPGEWRTVTSPSGQVMECYVVAGYRSVTMECIP
jgi:hypothetical protein